MAALTVSFSIITVRYMGGASKSHAYLFIVHYTNGSHGLKQKYAVLEHLGLSLLKKLFYMGLTDRNIFTWNLRKSKSKLPI